MAADFNQDDARERAMVAALNLDQRADRGRHDEDAHLDVEVDGQQRRLLFECKSTPENSDFGTGRDTGPRQLRRWSQMHFVFGWFAPRDNRPKRMWYGSPTMMRRWIEAELAYLQPDLDITALLPEAVTADHVVAILGDKEVYTFQDMQRLLKNQWNADARVDVPNRYITNADVRRAPRASENLYSRDVAEEAVRDRVKYLLTRGATVNNRKIGCRYVMGNCIELHPPSWARDLHVAIQAAWSNESNLTE